MPTGISAVGRPEDVPSAHRRRQFSGHQDHCPHLFLGDDSLNIHIQSKRQAALRYFEKTRSESLMRQEQEVDGERKLGNRRRWHEKERKIWRQKELPELSCAVLTRNYKKLVMTLFPNLLPAPPLTLRS